MRVIIFPGMIVYTYQVCICMYIDVFIFSYEKY